MQKFEHNIVLNDNFIAVLDGNKCKNLSSFYKEISKALNFPDYFGNNLDSLDEMMSDLEWIEEKSVVLIIMNGNNFLSEDSDKLVAVNGIFVRATIELENFKISLTVHIQKL